MPSISLSVPAALRKASPLLAAVMLMSCSVSTPQNEPQVQTSEVLERVDTSDWTLNAAPFDPDLSGYATGPTTAVIEAGEDHDATKYGGNFVFASAQCLDDQGEPTVPSGYVSGSDDQPTTNGYCYYGSYDPQNPHVYICQKYQQLSDPAVVRLHITCPADAVEVLAYANNNYQPRTLTIPLPEDAAPNADLHATPNPVEVGGSALLSLFADDDVDIASYTLDCDSNGTPEFSESLPDAQDLHLTTTQTCTYLTTGVVTATLEATDSLGQTGSATLQITVEDTTPPVLHLGGPYSGNPGTDILVDLTATDNGELATYTLDCGHGAALAGNYPEGSGADTRSETCNLTEPGDYTVIFTATDTAGNAAHVETTLRINTPPTAAGTPAAAIEGDSVTVDAGASSDPDGTVVLYELDCDHDGVFEQSYADTSDLLCPAFPDDGPYTGSLRVTDDGGSTDTTTLDFAIANAAPVADAGPDQTSLYTGLFSVTGHFTDAGADDTHTYAWDFGDGTAPSHTLDASHTYSEPGIYTVTLTVTDDDGGVGHSTLQVTAVDSAAPCDLVVSEVMANPLDSDTRQWIELYNPTSDDIDLVGMVLSTLSHGETITASVVVPAGGYATLCRDAADAGFTCDYVLSDVLLETSASDAVTLNAAGVVITTTDFDATTQGESIASTCNDQCDPTTGITVGLSDPPHDASYGVGGNGTPGAATDDDQDQDGAGACDDDCDDTDAANYPGNHEICDGQDNNCSGVPDDGPDADHDGVADICDICLGDDTEDTDADTVPDDCDACPLDASDDSDDDGVCDSDDLCPDGDDTIDSDSDGTPDFCDPCPLDALDDSDGDGVCDGIDVCDGEDDTLDTDGDTVPDCLDPCPDDPDDLCNEETGDTGDTDLPTPPPVEIDRDGDGYTVSDGDCNDNDEDVNPGAEEIPDDGIDNDCNATIDDDDEQRVCGCEGSGCNSQSSGFQGSVFFGLAFLLVRRRQH